MYAMSWEGESWNQRLPVGAYLASSHATEDLIELVQFIFRHMRIQRKVRKVPVKTAFLPTGQDTRGIGQPRNETQEDKDKEAKQRPAKRKKTN